MDTISLRKKFALFDRDGDGIITVEDLRRFLKSMGQNAADLEVEKLITAFDVNHDGKISFEEFCTLSTFSLSSQDQELALMEVFRQFDKDGNGYIDVQEMRTEVRSLLGRTLSEKEVVEMFRIADADGNDQLDYQEFVKVIMVKSAEAVEPLESKVPSSLVGFSFIDGISEQSWNFVEQLCQQAHSHQALNHLYLQRLAMGELPDVEGALKDYAIQYSEYSGNFQQYLNLALSNLEKREHKQLVSDNYKEERGYVDEHHQKQLTDLGIELEWIHNVPHTVLFRRFQNALGISGSEQQPTCSEAKQFHEKIQDICSEDAASAIGAIGLAGELGVSQIYRYILEAIKRHTPLAPREYVFFTLHTQMDDEHWHSLKAIGADLANSAENQQKLRSSMEAALEARCKFWDALLERALKMPEKQNILLPPSQLYESNSQKWVRQEPSCLSDFTARPAIFNLCEPVRNAMVLDLGCGEGYCSRELMRRGASKVIGVDISANLIAAAQMEEADEPLGITYLTGNSTDVLELLQRHNLLAGQEEHFDLVVAVFLFNYLTSHEMLQCMRQVQKLLKPGGRLIFSVPHPSFAFLSRPESTFYFDIQGLAQSDGSSLGYFSARDWLLPGEIARRDGTKLPVQVRHKTVQDYFDALQKSGFNGLPIVRELTVLDEHIQQDGSFFNGLYDIPLHLAFSIQKNNSIIIRRPVNRDRKAIIKDLVWSRIFQEEDCCFQLPEEVLNEFRQTYQTLQLRNITWENYEVGIVGDLPHLQTFARQMGNCCYESTGFVLIQKFPLEEFGESYEAREAAAKLFYYMMSLEIGIVWERRGRLYDVRDRSLNVANDNVLFSATKEASGWHTDSTDKDFYPDIVGLFCLQDGAEGGVLQVTNAINVYYRLKQILPQSIFDELEKPIVRDLIEKGLGEKSGDVWEQLRRSSKLKVQQYRLRNNRFPIFSRDPYTNEFSCRYMRYWIESGHQKAAIPLSPLLTIAMNALDDVIDNDSTIYRIGRKLQPGEIIYTNNHICLHNRTAYEEKVNQPKRHMIRVWIDFNPERKPSTLSR